MIFLNKKMTPIGYYILNVIVLSSQFIYSQNLILTNTTINSEKINLKQSLLMADSEDNNYDPLRTEIDYTILGSLSALYLGSGIGMHLYQQKAWWSDQKVPFHFTNDWAYARSIDKVGHFYGATLLAHAFSAGLEAANFSTKDSYLYSGIAALAFQMYVEIEDGFGPKWGFSPGDAAADFLGAAFSTSQYYFPYLKNFQMKISYLPSQKFRNGETFSVIDDYEGQKYWLAFRMEELLPETAANFWPDFLNLAVGYGVDKLDGVGGGDSEFYIGLDFDAEQIPLHGKFWQFIKNTLNYVHFPLPGIRISPDAAFLAFAF